MSRTTAPHFPELYQPLKELNAQLNALKCLTQDFTIETMPQWVSFAATTACNLRCPHCQTHGTEDAHRQYNRKSRRWDSERLRALAAECLPTAYEFNLTLNGEPLVLADFTERVQDLSRYGAKLDVNTNGTLFTKEILVGLLPNVGTLSISIDGATKYVCEVLRRGVRFEKLLHNIRLVTRTCELLEGLIQPRIRLAFTLMASNIREMPEMVRLARCLRVPSVVMHPVEIFFPHLRDEAIAHHRAAYNAYQEKTSLAARRLAVDVYMPSPFPGVTADADISSEGNDRIIQSLPFGYYDTLPEPETYLDRRAIESEASEIAGCIRMNLASAESSEAASRQLEVRARGLMEIALERHTSRLNDAAGSIPYCDYLADRLFVDTNGEVAPCCIPGRPVLGDTKRATLREIWNGDAYNRFRGEFFSAEPPDCCNGCRFRVELPVTELLTRIAP